MLDKMAYSVCGDLCDKYDESTVYISADEDTERNYLVVYMDYDGPSLFMAVSMKAYMERRAKEIQKI